MEERSAIFLLSLFSTLVVAAEEYEIGGPLAGVKLPLFPTQHGEPPGYPGVLPGETVAVGDEELAFDKEGLSPERHLHPESVEHWRANDFKYLPVRSLFDRQTLLKNWRASELPGVDKASIETYAEPVYWVRRHRDPVLTERTLSSVDVVRVRPGSPAFELDCGVLDAGMYMISVVGAVETAEIIRSRKPLVLKLTVNDGVDGREHTYRMRCGYVDQFYSVAEFYFHAPTRRGYTVSLQSGANSMVPLLVHNMELHDVLAGRTRRAIKMRMTWNRPRDQAALVEDDLPAEERRTRNRELWQSFLPLNAQFGIVYGMASNDGKDNWPNLGAAGVDGKAINKQHGKWIPGQGDVLATNRQLKLGYTIADYRSGGSLPDPYPYKDDGTGLWYPAQREGEKPQNWIPVASAIAGREAAFTRKLNGLASTYWTEGSLKAGRDAAMMLARAAYVAPSRSMHQAMSSVLMQPGAHRKDARHRHRLVLRGRWALDAYTHFDAYDKLFPLISTDRQLAESLGQFIPWIKKPEDVVQLMDVYLVQEKAKRYMRYHEMDNNNPAFMATVAAMFGAPEVTDPWMEWLFTRTWVYPLSVSGLADMLISGNDRDGAKFIGSLYYAHVENASTSGEMLAQAIEAGASPRYDLRDQWRYPKTVAACHWFLDVRLAGLWYPRVGDVCGPSASYGHWMNIVAKPMRRGWRWTGEPKFAWMLTHVYGRKDMTDEEWAAVEAAAARERRAPWTRNRSRVLPNWFGALESGTEHDDYRFRRCAYLRIGQGYGHAHADTLDLGIYAHGLPMTTEGGQRPGYSRPADASSRVHNLVEVNDRGWQGHAWVTALSDAEGARYVAADAIPPSSFPDVNLRRRQVALVDVDEGMGSRPLTPEEMQPGYRGLDTNIVSPNSYVFDVNRIAGGKTHTYCFNGNSEDELVVNMAKRGPIDTLREDEKKYLASYPDSTKCYGGDAPETVVATWRMNRSDKGSRGPEQSHARFPWSDDLPRKYTRLHLLEQQGGRVLAGEYFCHQGGNGFTVLHARHTGDQETNRVFTVIIEPFVGEPFIDGVKSLSVENNEADARKAVAVEVRTRNGHVDWLFSDGRPGKTRGVSGQWAVDSEQLAEVSVSGEFAYLSRDAGGVRLASLTGGRLLRAEDIVLEPEAAARTGTVVAVDYLDKQLVLDTPWPGGALLEDRAFEIGTGDHWTTHTIAQARRRWKKTTLTLRRGADFYQARVLDVEPDKGLVHCNLGLPFQGGGAVPGVDRHWVASDEQGNNFWRAEYLGGDRSANRYSFRLTGGPVAKADFGRLQGFRLWWYGVGDTVRQSTFASLRRLEPGLYELSADTAIKLALKAERLEVSSDGKSWKALKTRMVDGLAQAEIPLSRFDQTGHMLIRVVE